MKKIPFIDLHEDIADNCLMLSGKDFFACNKLHQGFNNAGFPVNNQVDFLRLKKSGAKLIFGASCPFILDQGEIKITENSFLATKKQLSFYRKLFKKSEELILVKNKKDYWKIKKEKNKIGVILHIEGADFLSDNPALLGKLFSFGVRSIGLTHNEKNELASGASTKGGITKKGRAIIKEIIKLGMIFDLAHLNRQSLGEALEIVKPPFMCSHAGIFFEKKHPRNLKKEEILKICRKGGIIGLAFTPSFYSSNDSEALVSSFKYFKKIAGTDNLAIGSDFDGMISEKLFSELSEISQTQNLILILKKAGFSEAEIEKVFFKNAEEKLINLL